MIKLSLLAATALFAGWSAPSSAPLSFEVASVKTAAPCCAPGQWRESKVGEDRIDFRYVTLRYSIAFAYRLKEYQVSGPPFLGELRFDIVAKGPEGTRREQLPEMMRTLLEERFKLAVHLEKKEYNVFALLVGKGGPKLKESPVDPDGPAGASFGISTSATGVGRIEVRHADMIALANTLPRMVGRPVVDLTGLAGRFDFDLEFSRDDVNGIMMPPQAVSGALPAPELGVSIFTSVQRIGLKLDPQKLPLDSVVVDRVEKTAAEN